MAFYLQMKCKTCGLIPPPSTSIRVWRCSDSHTHRVSADHGIFGWVVLSTSSSSHRVKCASRPMLVHSK